MTPVPPHHPAYRADIDGLRAIAVLSVVLYHFGVPLRGGFTGVDVFFVISGYLIGGILWREYSDTGAIRLGQFYMRRFRRLAPAFFAMVAGTALAGWMILLPFEYREFGKSAIAATVYLSNVLFWRQTGYFDAAAHDKPLLHTWSLAVEEQFYIFLPLAILLVARSPRLVLAVLCGTWLVSFVACVLLTPSQPSAAFYLFPFRAWEMLSGVLLAIWMRGRGLPDGAASIGAVAGLGLVVASVLFIPASGGFPGAIAAVPVLGAGLLLACGQQAKVVGQLLRLPVMRFFGLISYSLYLWHWPVVVLLSALRGGTIELWAAVAGVALSVALGWASWRFVEQPVRRAKGLSAPVLLGGVVTASLGVAGFGLWVRAEDGLPQRFNAAAQTHIAASADFLQDFSRCSTPSQGPFAGVETCPIGPEGAPQVLIWGDSHVRALHAGLDLLAHESSIPGLVIWRAGCPPLFDITKEESAATPAQDAACARANDQIRRGLPELGSLSHVLLVGRWAYYATGQGVGLDAANHITVQSAQGGGTGSDALAQAARATVAELSQQGRAVFVLRQTPEIPDYDSRQAAREAAHAGLPFAAAPKTRDSVAEAELASRAAQADAPWLPLAEAGAIQFIDPWPLLCADGRCSALQGGTGQYFDNNHLTNSAARRVRSALAPVFAVEGGS
ncbi:acyltransferase family protein [Sagittula sp. SSi028]|uniref:acyltransferase family protein n=1 Tax=Sagittula sp. SSi028 TaxID=3400636 RepID=UPI003AF40CE0